MKSKECTTWVVWFLYSHKKLQLLKMEVLHLVSLFWGWGFPYVSLTHSWKIGEKLYFRFLKCLGIFHHVFHSRESIDIIHPRSLTASLPWKMDGFPDELISFWVSAYLGAFAVKLPGKLPHQEEPHHLPNLPRSRQKWWTENGFQNPSFCQLWKYTDKDTNSKVWKILGRIGKFNVHRRLKRQCKVHSLQLT